METIAGSLYYVLTDHLGSWEKVLDANKNTVQQTHFDPWGNRMSYTAWNTKQPQTSFMFDRGFTGHEHYDCMHIINANARLYDPAIGRFFSPDPFVQTPESTQGFNRYSYCMNNPEEMGYDHPNRPSPLCGHNIPTADYEYGAWDPGFVYSCPLWIGWKHGNSISRVGYSHPFFQDATQNTVHKYFPKGRMNFYLDYDWFNKGFYMGGGYYNPFSLY